MSIEILALTQAHRPAWQPLAEGYKAFYKTPTTPAEYDRAWARLMAARDVHGLGANLDGRLVGIVHFLHHGSTWADTVCYLQDLYTAPEARGRGVARALIGAVAGQAREAGAARLYWLTQEDNAVARALYEQVARYNGFIRYDFALA
ncbi:MAG: GNAT family N-acetyltransferase [Rubrivivax sp.]